METTNTGRAFTRYSYLGTTDEHTTCDCCGKEDLKSTVGIRDIETGEDVFFGSTCAARALKVKVAEVRKGTAAADESKRVAAERARREAFEAECRAFHAWAEARTGVVLYDRFGNPDREQFVRHFGEGAMLAARRAYLAERIAA